MTCTYRHFCPVARALEKIGDKWSLLVIRDLLVGPQRFTDLLDYLHPITPKWLTHRLRELENSGIVERETRAGRREVRYKLTPMGYELGPIIEALASWGYRHALHPPLPEETVHPELLMRSLTASLNKSGRRSPRPTQWLIRFPRRRFFLIFDGHQWDYESTEAEKAELTASTTPETWASVFTAPRAERPRLAKFIHLKGEPDRVREFLSLFDLLPQRKKDSHVPSRGTGKGLNEFPRLPRKK